ncbi:MAG: hypothetical protein ACLTZM_16540 [Ruminococcus sp.]
MVIQLPYCLDRSLWYPAFFSRIDLWMDAIDFGAVLVVDEIEASMHPLITRHLIEMIQNQTINQKNVIKRIMKKVKWHIYIPIIISILSLLVAWRAYETCKLQTELTKNSFLPNIQVKENLEYYNKSDTVTNEVIEISNIEGRINNYCSKIITYIKCDFCDKNLDFFEAKIPVENYYIVSHISGNSLGVIETKRSLDNVVKVNKLIDEVLRYNNVNEAVTLHMEVESCLEITYSNLMDENNEIYFLVDNWKTEKIEESEGKICFERQNRYSNLGLGIDLNVEDNISVDNLIEK